MSTYNTETVNIQFINSSFLDKVEGGMVKEAEIAMSAFVRQKIREDGFTRKILPPVPISAAELDRQVTEEPTVIAEKEPDSVAASMPFLARPEIRYWNTPRYPVTFAKISSDTFKKDKNELLTYRTDIRTVLQENSVKDIQKQEDQAFYNNIVQMATDNGNLISITGGFTKANLLNGIKPMLKNFLTPGCILMTQSMYVDMLSWAATEIGSPAASELYRGQAALDNFFGYKIITTNKHDIIPDTRALVFAPPSYFGQFYTLQDATTFIKAERDMIEFDVRETVGVGIGNVNGALVLDF